MLDYATFQGKPIDKFGWVRDPLWPVLPVPNSNEIYILTAVFNDDTNFAALSVTVTGGYTVDWGDGTVENFSSAATAEHKYTFSDADIIYSYNSRMKFVIIKVTTQAANDITAFDLSKAHSQSGLNNRHTWLEIFINTPSATSMKFSASSYSRAVLLENVEIFAIGNVTSLEDLFTYAHSLQRVIFPSGSLQSVTDIDNMFYYCYSLRYMTFPEGSLQSVTSASSVFFNCSALRYVDWPEGSLVSVTGIQGMFYSCSNLVEAIFPDGSLSANASLTTTFNACASLTYIKFPTGGFASLTTVTSAFNSCFALRRIENLECPITFTIADCNLSPTELDEVYTALPTVTSKTITVTGNWGVSGDDPSIATAKGWTVTGS